MASIPASPSQSSPWSVFMEGAPLSSALRMALIASPAGRYAVSSETISISIA